MVVCVETKSCESASSATMVGFGSAASLVSVCTVPDVYLKFAPQIHAPSEVAAGICWLLCLPVCCLSSQFEAWYNLKSLL